MTTLFQVIQTEILGSDCSFEPIKKKNVSLTQVSQAAFLLGKAAPEKHVPDPPSVSHILRKPI